MNRPVMALLGSLVVALGGVAGAASAHAEPPPPGTLCSFTLSQPHLAPASGADMVAATVTPAGCAAPFRPRLSVVCLQHADSPTRCSQARDGNIAQVTLPYHPGATYTATGRGLGAVFDNASEPNWQLLGPHTAVLP